MLGVQLSNNVIINDEFNHRHTRDPPATQRSQTQTDGTDERWSVQSMFKLSDLFLEPRIEEHTAFENVSKRYGIRLFKKDRFEELADVYCVNFYAKH